MQEQIFDKWFSKLTNTKLYLIAYLFIVSIFMVAILVIFNIVNKNDVSTISINNVNNSFHEKEEYINDYFEPYITSLHALSDNTYLDKYINNTNDKQIVEDLFLTIQKSFPDIFQVRLIDMQGMEQIRIDRKSLLESQIVPSSLLQDKSNRDYFQQFKKLSQGEIGLSKIDLNIEHNKIELPKKTTIRLGKVLYDTQGNRRAILVYNIYLQNFFHKLHKSTFYNIYIIDNQGHYILNNTDNHGGMEGNNFNNITLFDIYGERRANQILKQSDFYGETLYSSQIKNIKNGQNLKMILELKFGQISQDISSIQNKFIYFLICIAIAFLPLVYFFAKTPQMMQEKLDNNQNTDEITNAPNHRCLFTDLQKHQFKDSVIILVQINNYIKIQNIYGHEIANKLMKMISESLNNYQEENLKKIYRYNNDGFALKYDYQNLEMMIMFLRQIHTYLEAYSYFIEDDIEILLDVTVGASSPEQLNNNIDELKEAEIALEHALDQRHDFFIYKNLHPHSIEVNKMTLQVAKKLKQAIDNNDLELQYQPIINNETNVIEKYETLMRIKNDEQLLFPDTFIPIAKELKKYKYLTSMLVEHSFAYFQDKPYEFSINLSIEDIQNEEFQQFLFAKIDEYQVNEKLVVEIVESENIYDYQFFYKFIKVLKKRNCKVAIDDFGSGYSNFQHIIALSDYIDYIKIDGSLINNILQDSKSQILVHNIHMLCKELGLKTIAEYVENRDIFIYLKALGIDYSQGYYIGKPSSDLTDELAIA